MYSNLFIHVQKKFLFYCLYSKKCKQDEMAFLTSRNASKHVLLALGVKRTGLSLIAGLDCGLDRWSGLLEWITGWILKMSG